MGAFRWPARAAPLALIAAVAPALACPVCNTGTGEQVRRGIFNDAFLATLLEIGAPLPVLAACVFVLQALLARGDARAVSHRHARAGEDDRWWARLATRQDRSRPGRT